MIRAVRFANERGHDRDSHRVAQCHTPLCDALYALYREAANQSKTPMAVM